MHDIQEQAARLLKRQHQNQNRDPLNNVRKEAISHLLTRILGAEGFTVLIVSTRKEKTQGLALAGGTFPLQATLRELLNALDGTARQFGVELEIAVKGPAHHDGSIINIDRALQ